MLSVGLDVSLYSVAICVVDEVGNLAREGTTSADAPSIARYLESRHHSGSMEAGKPPYCIGIPRRVRSIFLRPIERRMSVSYLHLMPNWDCAAKALALDI